ncbi:MAG: hypothetical protein JO165_13325 [Candidatus Eremiobacteraeota bacterium]|nr:hypothetical protein [Candidatus Eremiobacteraeota bacterium]
MKRRLFTCAAALVLIAAAPAPSSTSAPNRLAGMQWRMAGAAVSGGRLAAVAGTDADPSLYYIGAAGGGVWKTTNAGQSFRPVFDGQSVQSIGAVAIDPKNESVVWVGTGEGNPRNDVSQGNGVYRSSDGGKTWQHVLPLHNALISSLVVNATDTNSVVVAVLGDPFASDPDRGIYRTTDGGKTWNKTLFVDNDTGAADLATSVKTPNTIYAAMWQYRRTGWSTTSGGAGSGLYKSTDGGSTWQRLSGRGLPQEPYGRIGLAVAPSNPNRVFALIETKQTNGIPGALYRSDDNGATWTQTTHNTLIDERPFYYTRVFVDPTNQDHVWTTTVHLTESTDGGKNFHTTGRGLHGDHHAMWISQDGKRIVEGNDGGVGFSWDDGASWEWRNVVPIGQLYHVGYDRRNPYTVCAPLQDNGSWCAPNNGLTGRGTQSAAQWRAMGGGDGTWTWPDPVDPDIVWSSFGGGNWQGVLEVINTRTNESYVASPYLHGQNAWAPSSLQYRLNWETPFAFDPFDGHLAYVGGNVLFSSRDRGHHWKVISPELTRDVKAHQDVTGGLTLDVTGAETTDTILDVAPSPIKRGQIWVGTDDGYVQLTRDGGAHWTNVTPDDVRNANDANGWGRFASISPSNRNPAAAVAVYDLHMVGDRTPHVYLTRDYGKQWTSVTAGLPPAEEARSVRFDPHDDSIVYLGLENSLWVSFDTGAHWQKFNNNLPAVSVRDIRVQPDADDIILATHGRSIWILDDATPVQQFRAAQGKTYLFPIRTAYMYNSHGYWNTLRGDGESPPYGAIVTYNLDKPLRSAPTADVIDSSGRVVRHLGRTKDDELPNKPGLNRFTWDLSEDAPANWEFTPTWNQGTGGGVFALPGKYTVVLHVASQTLRQAVEVKQDPRTQHSIAELAATQRAQRDLFNAIDRVDKALNVLSTVVNEAPLRAAQLQNNPTLAQQVQTAGAQAKELLLTITQNPQNDQDDDFLKDILRERLIWHLNSYEGSFAPTPAQLAENRALMALTTDRMDAFAKFRDTDLKAINAQLTAAKLKPLTELTVKPKIADPGSDDRRRRGDDD